MHSSDDSFAIQRGLEQTNLHLLAAEGELAAATDETGDRNASADNIESRLRQARSELHQARHELHRTASLMDSVTLARCNLGFVAGAEFLQADAEGDLAQLSAAAKRLRSIYQGLGGPTNDYDDDNVLTRAQDKKSRNKRLAKIGFSIVLALYLPYVGWQIKTYPERVDNALLERLTPHCESHPECLQALSVAVPDCAKAQLRWGLFLLNTLGPSRRGDAPALIHDWSEVIDCVNRAAGKRILDEVLVTNNMTPSAHDKLAQEVGKKGSYKPALDLPIGQNPNEKKP
jgi:hypothetical protein